MSLVKSVVGRNLILVFLGALVFCCCGCIVGTGCQYWFLGVFGSFVNEGLDAQDNQTETTNMEGGNQDDVEMGQNTLVDLKTKGQNKE
jgi:hypothetical protein